MSNFGTHYLSREIKESFFALVIVWFFAQKKAKSPGTERAKL